MLAGHASLKEPSSHGITIDRNHLIGLLVGIILGVLCTLLFVFSFVRFCRPVRRRIRSRTNHPLRLRFHDESRSISNMELESQIRHSLLHDHPMYANPSPIDRSIQSASTPRYNFLLHQSPLLSREMVSNFTLRSFEEPSTTTGFYDRLSENTGKWGHSTEITVQPIAEGTQSNYAHLPLSSALFSSFHTHTLPNSLPNPPPGNSNTASKLWLLNPLPLSSTPTYTV